MCQSSCATSSDVLEIIMVVFFKKEAWLLIIGPERERPSSRFRAKVRDSVDKISLHAGN